jgi:glycosyltransferase involved in cell wall biosynthesis
MEFFGLPVLEAMASNVPVVAANKMSIPEVVNDAGILVEPDDIRQVAEKIYEVLTSETLQSSLIKKGQHNIQVFNWDVTAGKFEKVFLEIAEKFSLN